MTNEAILETLKVQPLTEEEKSKRHILKRLTGPIASCKEGTRNGRRYNKELWEQALNDEIFKEKVGNKGLFLELGHPDREEIDMSCACACIPEIPKIIDGDLYAVVDVLDTPAGKILNTLIDYGFRPGISSRGTGDVVGDEVDPETFCLETWDIVNIPALEKARLTVTEGLNQNETKLRTALCESLKEASDEDKKVMKESLDNLGINIETDSNSEKSEDKLEETKEQTISESNTAINNGAEEIIKSLQESLKSNAELEAKVKSLQEELAVSDTKVTNLEEELSKSKNTIVHLTTLAKGSREKTEQISKLEEELKKANTLIESLKKRPLRENLKETNTLKENLAKKDEEIKSHKDTINSLTEQLNTVKATSESEINTLKESIKTEKEKHAKELNSLNESLTESKKLVEKYVKLTDHIANKYIATKARQLGVEPDEIKNRLSENYTLKEVDKVCENLKNYKINISKLPFVLDDKSVVTLKESKHVGINTDPSMDDDFVSEDTLRMAGLK